MTSIDIFELAWMARQTKPVYQLVIKQEPLPADIQDLIGADLLRIEGDGLVVTDKAKALLKQSICPTCKRLIPTLDD